jgi:hypothetical protein
MNWTPLNLAVCVGCSLACFAVWAYQVNPVQVSVGDSVDLSKRLDGSATVRFSQPLGGRRVAIARHSEIPAMA